MDIGPVRRRFTAEPVVPPVPAEATPVHEPATPRRGTAEEPPAASEHDTVAPTRA